MFILGAHIHVYDLIVLDYWVKLKLGVLHDLG